MKSCFTLLFSLLGALAASAQYAPQVGIAGSDAVPATAASIKGWASKCTLYRGLQDIADPGAGHTGLGDEFSALGPADLGVVSLGDSGIAVLEFSSAIVNGPGPDFAVFENGFANPSDKEEAFLELAFVEVSSDGSRFFRFPAASNTSTATQVRGSGDYMNARNLYNLAGKYISRNGTPFDLEELKGLEGLDINNITHVRIVDVIGAINGAHQSKDKDGNTINDPYPTPFNTGGFDLDAVAVLNSKSSGIPLAGALPVQVYPNPAADYIFVEQLPAAGNCQAILTDISGRIVWQNTVVNGAAIDVSRLLPGLYYISIIHTEGKQWTGKISKI